MIRKRQLARHI